MNHTGENAEEARIRALETYGVMDSGPDAEFDGLARLAARMVGVPMSTVTLVHRDRQWFKAAVGVSIGETERGISFCSHTIAQGEPLVLADAREDPRFAANPLVTGAPFIRFYAGVAMRTPEGHAIGSVCVMDSSPREITPGQLDSLQIIAAQAMQLLELRQQRRSLRDKVGALDATLEERRLAVERLQVSEERFRALFELSPIGTAVVAPDGRWVLVNQCLCDIFGYTAEQLYARSFQSMTHPDDVPGSVERLDSLMAGETASYSVEKRYLRADGSPVWTRITVAAVHGPDGLPAYFLTSVVDIDARKRADLKLVESEFRYRQMFESSPQPMWVGDRETRKFIDVNAAALAHYGYSRAEFLAMNLVDIRAPEVRDNPLESLLVPPSGSAPRKYARRHRRKDGAILESVIAVQWLDYEGRPAIVVLVNDVTALVAAEQRMQRLNSELEQRVRERTNRLEQANRELEAFTYSVAHDLRAPLRAIHGFSRLLLEDEAPQLSNDGKASLKRVLKASAVMEEIIDDLLAYSRIEREAAEVGPISLAPLCRAILDARAEELRQGGDVVVNHVPELQVLATHGGLTLALRNLLDNAIKFSRQSSPPRIELSASTADGICTFAIRDNGIGFEMDYHDKIFEIFQRLHPADAYAGTGIGLAIVRKAMQRMGGAVWAESTAGQGAIFYLRLPLAP